MKKRRLTKAYSHAVETKDKGGVSRQQIFDFKKLGEEPKFYSPAEGINKINIIPFEVKSKNHPLIKQGRMEIGDLDFALDIWVHRYVGPSQADIVCLKKNYGKPCPICTQSGEYYDQGKKEEGRKTKAQRRIFVNVQPIVKGEVKPLQIFDVSHFLFMKELMEEAHECGDGEDIIPFADIESGKVIKFRAIEEELGENKMMSFKSFQFLDREEELDEKIIDQAVSFDDCLTVLPAEQIEKLFFGADDEEEEDDEKPAKKSSKANDDDDDEEEDEKPVKKSSKHDSEEDDDEEEDDEKPAKKSSKSDDDDDEEEDAKPVKKSSKADDDDEEEEDEKPAKKSSSKKECPHGHTYGKDCDDFKECGKCKLWDDCMEAGK